MEGMIVAGAGDYVWWLVAAVVVVGAVWYFTKK